jgi:AcrR family transcriptional regulator
MTDDKHTTKERLLDAAERLFAESGFDEVSIRDLAAAADVNVAAVNYHFQGKENLYHEVIRRRFTVQRDATLASLAAVMPTAGRPQVADVIRAIAGQYLRGALAQGGGARVMAAISREMHTNYDTRHMLVFKEMIAPIFAAFSAAMLQARPGLTQEDANWAIASIVGQVHHFIMRRLKFDSLPSDDDVRAFMQHAFPVLAAPMDDYVAHVTEHITRFSTAAIDGMHPEVTP